MAQQQPQRDDFGNVQKTHVDVRDRDRDRDRNRDRDVCKNEEMGGRTAADPVTNYAYGSGESGGYGGAPYSTAYGTTDAVPPPYADPTGFGSGAAAGYGNTGAGVAAGQWGREANADRGDSGRNRNRNVNLGAGNSK